MATTRKDVAKLPARLGEAPEKVAVKIKQGGSIIADALEQARNAVLMLTEWQGEFLSGLVPVIKAGETFQRNLNLYQKYGQVSSIQEALEKLPLSREARNEIARIIDKKIKDWTAANEEISFLVAKFRVKLVKDLLARFACKSLDRIPCCIAPEVVEWLESYRIPDLLSFGPLAALLAYTRAVKRISASTAAQLCGVKESTYKAWEAGCAVPHRRSWSALADFTGRSDIGDIIEMQRNFRESSARR